jgi:hypothetical protein
VHLPGAGFRHGTAGAELVVRTLPTIASRASGGCLTADPRCSLSCVGQGNAAGHDDGAEDPGTVLRRRHDEISERIEQLHQRHRHLTDRLTRGSTLGEATEAQAYAKQAHAHAEQAHELAAGRHAEAAALHEHLAEVLDQLDRPDQAQVHREAAEHERTAADDEDRAAQEEGRREQGAEGR